MGSFQQISIGTVCLVAAFMFGNYVNNHPHPDQVTNALTELESDVNPVAKTSLIEPGKIIQRSAPMATMKSKPAARYPQMSLFKGTIKNGFDGSATEASSNPLPPPSQLGASSPFENNLEQRLVGQANKNQPIEDSTNSDSRMGSQTKPRADAFPKMPNLLESSERREIVVPDFSQLASGFRNTPLALPGHDRSRPASKMNTGQGFGASLSTLSPHTPPGSLSQQADRPHSQQRSGWPNKPELVGNSDPMRGSNQLEISQSPEVKTIPSEFSQDQFEPSLKDYSSTKSANAQTSVVQLERQPLANDRPNVRLPTGQDEKFRGVPSGNVRSLQGEYYYADSNSNSGATAGSSVATSPTVPVNLPYDASWNTSKPPIASLRSIERQSTPSRETMLNREQDQAEFASPPVPPTDNETYRAAKPLIPFGLTQAERKNLVRLQRPSRANQIDVGTTRFKSYTSQPGDTLQNLSTRYYGRPDFYLDIYLANKARLRNPGYLPAGVELQIPIY